MFGGKSEISNFNSFIFEENISGFEVSVDDLFVENLHVTENDLFQVLEGLRLGQALLNDFGQISVLAEFGDDEGVLSGFVDVENFDDILWGLE